MATEITLHGRVVARSRNLRGLLDYARKRGVLLVQTDRTPSGASVFVQFGDCATTRVEFADFTVAQKWIDARHSWGLALKSSTADSEHWESK